MKRAISIHILITFLAWYMHFNKKRQDRYTHWSLSWLGTCTSKPGKWSVCISILPFLLKYMYQARKVISVCIDLVLFYWSTCTKPGKWYKKVKIDTHTDHFPGLVHVLQLKGQDRYTHWSLSWFGTCTSIKRARSIHTLITFLVIIYSICKCCWNVATCKW
jgi:hypothetical protein